MTLVEQTVNYILLRSLHILSNLIFTFNIRKESELSFFCSFHKSCKHTQLARATRANIQFVFSSLLARFFFCVIKFLWAKYEISTDFACRERSLIDNVEAQTSWAVGGVEYNIYHISKWILIEKSWWWLRKMLQGIEKESREQRANESHKSAHRQSSTTIFLRKKKQET